MSLLPSDLEKESKQNSRAKHWEPAAFHLGYFWKLDLQNFPSHCGKKCFFFEIFFLHRILGLSHNSGFAERYPPRSLDTVNSSTVKEEDALQTQPCSLLGILRPPSPTRSHQSRFYQQRRLGERSRLCMGLDWRLCTQYWYVRRLWIWGGRC